MDFLYRVDGEVGMKFDPGLPLSIEALAALRHDTDDFRKGLCELTETTINELERIVSAFQGGRRQHPFSSN